MLCVSIPKAGTHLLERALCLHPRLYRALVPTITMRKARRYGGVDRLLARLRPGEVVMAHLPFDPAYTESAARRGVRVVFMVRDPRDVVISQVRYVTGRTDHWAHGLFTAKDGTHEQLRLAIAGDPVGRPRRSLDDRLAEYEGWLDAATYVLRFEDLVGVRGGGDATRQRDSLGGLFRAIGLPADPVREEAIARALFSADSPTFRKGTIGQWREVFDDELRDLAKDVAGARLRRFGYEP